MPTKKWQFLYLNSPSRPGEVYGPLAALTFFSAMSIGSAWSSKLISNSVFLGFFGLFVFLFVVSFVLYLVIDGKKYNDLFVTKVDHPSVIWSLEHQKIQFVTTEHWQKFWSWDKRIEGNVAVIKYGKWSISRETTVKFTQLFAANLGRTWNFGLSVQIGGDVTPEDAVRLYQLCGNDVWENSVNIWLSSRLRGFADACNELAELRDPATQQARFEALVGEHVGTQLTGDWGGVFKIEQALFSIAS